MHSSKRNSVKMLSSVDRNAKDHMKVLQKCYESYGHNEL